MRLFTTYKCCRRYYPKGLRGAIQCAWTVLRNPKWSMPIYPCDDCGECVSRMELSGVGLSREKLMGDRKGLICPKCHSQFMDMFRKIVSDQKQTKE